MSQPKTTDDDESTESIVEEAKERFKRGKEYYDSQRILAKEDTKFAMGDSDNLWQWPADVLTARSTQAKRVCLTVNTTAQHCNQVINSIRQNRPSLRVSPVDNKSDKKTAELLGGLVRNIQARSAADDAHDVAAEHMVYGGEGYWRVLTEYDSPDSFDQQIRIKAIQNPGMVIIDPDCKELDRSDAAWGFVFEDISEDDFKRDYPGVDPQSWTLDARKDGWGDEKTVRVADYYCLEWVDDTACLLNDGTTMLKSKGIPQGSIIVKERPTKIKKWTWYKLAGGQEKPIEETPWLGEFLPIITVVGKELNVDGNVIRKGIVRDLKDPARMLNYAYSETVQSLALQNKIPYMAAAEAIEGYEDVWEYANLENRSYLPFNAYDDDGNPLPKPERQAPAVMPAAQVQLLQLSTEQMRAASGQQNANFGIRSEAQSGIGIQRLKSQGEVATFHFPDNLARALRYEGKVLIDLIQKYYDTPRVVRILGLDGQESSATLNPGAQGYAEAPGHTTEDDVQKIFNPSVGRYDVVIDTGPAYQTQRQEAFDRLSDLAGRNPALMQIAGDLIMRAADFPMASELADRLEKALPPGLKDDDGAQAPIPPEMQQQLEQADQMAQMAAQHIDELTQQLQEAQNGERVKMADAQTKAAEAQAKMDADAAALEAKYQADMAEVKRKRDVSAAELQIKRDAAAAEIAWEREKLAMTLASDEELAKLKGYVELKKQLMTGPSPEMTADVEAEFARFNKPAPPPKPKRKRIAIQSPSGGVYHGTVDEEDIPEELGQAQEGVE